VLRHFADNWTFCPILWEMQNAHEDIDKTLMNADPKIIASPFIEILSVTPMEIPVSLGMKKAEFVFNILLAEPEGQGNKNTLEAIDSLNTIYSSKLLRLAKENTNNHVTLDFGEVELGSSELIQGKYLSMAVISCISFF
jgi:hypothetical protein